MKEIMYFGTIREAGHFLWLSEHSMAYTLHRESKTFQVPEAVFKFLDGNYVPTETREQCIYRYSKIGPCQFVSWHDYTIDKRPGSNSILIGIGFSDAEELIDHAYKAFPSVMLRQPFRPKPYTV